MISIQRIIAGLSVTIRGEHCLSMVQLEKELAIYPQAQDEPDILICYGKQDNDTLIANNPAIHREYADGFAASFGPAIVRWRWGNNFALVDWYSPVSEKDYLKKLFGIQYTHPFEQVGNIFFELVLIPTLQLFYHNHFLILHGSALASAKENKATVFGGTGGVGKTSIELEMVGDSFHFMADDITILDAKGTVWANFAWPKIYGYNTLANTSLKDRIFTQRSFIDRLSWSWRMFRHGSGRVRRRVAPESLFCNNIVQKASLDKYLLLFRGHFSKLKIIPVKVSTATDLSLAVMMSEYTILYRHLSWHKYNRIALKLSPLITTEEIFGQWRKLSHLIFQKARCFIVQVPTNYSALDLKTNLPSLLYKNQNPDIINGL
jgi:hypothetical protein